MSSYDAIRAAMDAAAEEAQLQADLATYRLNVATQRTEADPDWERELEEAIADAGRRATAPATKGQP